MTSQITYANIDEQYPVAGQDNDSQGFRDNFNSIKSALATASSEITTLQTDSLKAGDTNDLLLGSINNGYYNNFHGTAYSNTVGATNDIDVSAASIHIYTMTVDGSFTFRNWPADTYYGKVRVHLVSNGSNSYTPTFYAAGGGTVKLDNSFPNPVTVSSNGKHQVFEAWSYNHGAAVFIKYMGSF